MSERVEEAAGLVGDLETPPSAAGVVRRASVKSNGNGSAPTTTQRRTADMVDTRDRRTKTTLLPSLDVEAARKIWDRAHERHRLLYRRVSEGIAELAANDTVTVDDVLARALKTAADNNPMPADLLDDLAAAEQREQRRSTARHAHRLLADRLSRQLSGLVVEVDAKLVEAIGAEANAVLREARKSATALAGVGTAEAAIERGVADEWLSHSKLAERWMCVQRSRLWRSRAIRDGFDHQVSDQPDRLRAGTTKIEQAQEVWKVQFDDSHVFGEYDTAEDVLDHYLHAFDDGVDIMPIV